MSGVYTSKKSKMLQIIFFHLQNNTVSFCNNLLSHKIEKSSKMLPWIIWLLGSLVARSNRPKEPMGHPRRASRNSLFWIFGMKSVSHQHNAAKVKAQLFCCSGERFQEQESHRVLSSPASSRVAEPSTALQFTPLPGVCTLSPSWMNYGPEKYSWTCFQSALSFWTPSGSSELTWGQPDGPVVGQPTQTGPLRAKQIQKYIYK